MNPVSREFIEIIVNYAAKKIKQGLNNHDIALKAFGAQSKYSRESLNFIEQIVDYTKFFSDNGYDSYEISEKILGLQESLNFDNSRARSEIVTGGVESLNIPRDSWLTKYSRTNRNILNGKSRMARRGL